MNPQRPDHGQRSYSLTGTHHPSRLISKTNRSVTSLQSAGPSINRPRSPYQYSARFHRPDLRPTSPAWSDGNAASYHRPNFSRPMLGPRPAVSAYPFPPQGPGRPTLIQDIICRYTDPSRTHATASSTSDASLIRRISS